MSITVSKHKYSEGALWGVNVVIDDAPEVILGWHVHTREGADLLERALKETLSAAQDVAERQVAKALKLRKSLQDLNREGKDAV